MLRAIHMVTWALSEEDLDRDREGMGWCRDRASKSTGGTVQVHERNACNCPTMRKRPLLIVDINNYPSGFPPVCVYMYLYVIHTHTHVYMHAYTQVFLMES